MKKNSAAEWLEDATPSGNSLPKIKSGNDAVREADFKFEVNYVANGYDLRKHVVFSLYQEG